MSLTTPDKLSSLQRKLYGKAKAEPAYRFYLLYDKIHRPDILEYAYALARQNDGAPGVDLSDVRDDRGGGCGRLAGGFARGTRVEELSADAGAAGEDSQTGRRGEASGHSHCPGQGRSNRRQTGVGADLRGGPGTLRLWVQARTKRARRRPGDAPADLPGLCGRRRRRSVQILRHHPASRAHAERGSTNLRPARAALDQAVAECPGRRAGRQGKTATGRGQAAQAGHAARRRDQPDAGQPLHEPVSEALADARMRRGVPRPSGELRRRLRHSQLRTRGGGADVDERGDGQIGAQPQRGQDLGEERQSGKLRLSRLHAGADVRSLSSVTTKFTSTLSTPMATMRPALRTAMPAYCRVEEGRGGLRLGQSPRFPFSAHQTGRADFRHPAFRQTSWRAHGVGL